MLLVSNVYVICNKVFFYNVSQALKKRVILSQSSLFHNRSFFFFRQECLCYQWRIIRTIPQFLRSGTQSLPDAQFRMNDSLDCRNLPGRSGMYRGPHGALPPDSHSQDTHQGGGWSGSHRLSCPVSGDGRSSAHSQQNLIFNLSENMYETFLNRCEQPT